MLNNKFFDIEEECGKKIDQHIDAFIKRIEFLRIGDTEKVEYIEKMILEPLDKQIAYLTSKMLSLLNKI